MKQGIMIGATPDTVGDWWLHDLGNSLLYCTWPIVIHRTFAFELDTIRAGSEQFDEFVFLPASTIVKNQGVFDIAFSFPGVSVNLGGVQGGGKCRMYLAKYRTEALTALGIPTVHSKAEAIAYEDSWCGAYYDAELARGKMTTLGAGLDHTSDFVEHNGRMNMVVENEWFIRLKGAWVPPDDYHPIAYPGGTA